MTHGPIDLMHWLQDEDRRALPGDKLCPSRSGTTAAAITSAAPSRSADVLGIFGREGVGLATYWALNDSETYPYAAFRAYRNYDGSGATFGDTSVQATSSDVPTATVYASIDAANTNAHRHRRDQQGDHDEDGRHPPLASHGVRARRRIHAHGRRRRKARQGRVDRVGRRQRVFLLDAGGVRVGPRAHALSARSDLATSRRRIAAIDPSTPFRDTPKTVSARTQWVCRGVSLSIVLLASRWCLAEGRPPVAGFSDAPPESAAAAAPTSNAATTGVPPTAPPPTNAAASSPYGSQPPPPAYYGPQAAPVSPNYYGVTPPPPSYYGVYPPPPSYYGVYPPPPIPPRPPRKVRHVSLTLSPIHLLFPVFEITAELRLANHVGLSVVGGIGSIGFTESGSCSSGICQPDTKVRASVQELGTQLVFYPLQAFDGLVLGAELDWVHLSVNDTGNNVTGVGAGTAFGPLIGYKWIFECGFTLFAHVGVQHVWAQADASQSTTGDTAHDEKTQWLPLVNLNLGWSL